LNPVRPICYATLLLASLHGCASIDIDRAAQRSVSRAIPQDTPSRLQKLAGQAAPGESGFVLLEAGPDALAARLWLADKAEKTLDVQYYIFHGDKTGALVGEALMRAAERGVRVRVLIDDIYAYKREADMLALDSHPNIEIRLFNPFYYRGGNPLLRLGQFLSDDRLNRRMHNKLFAADNQFAITGGRNIGDEYFFSSGELAFVDLDVMASGSVVAEMSASFDDYWASEAVVPVRALPGHKEARSQLPALKQALAERRRELEASDYGRALAVLHFEERLLSGKLPVYRGKARVIADPPEKVSGDLHVSDTMMGQLSGLGLSAKKEMLLVSPYFVPGRVGMAWFAYLRAQGARVRVLTNSLAASDVPVVHAGYARYRKELLKMGVELHELKPLPNASPRKTRITGSGSSRSSLHTKSFIFDRERVLIGSFNFDPRSALLNTELGLVIDNPAAAERVAAMAEHAMAPERSHRLSLGEDGENGKDGQSGILWHSRTDKGEIVTDTEPNTTWWQRHMLEIFMLLPIENQL